MISNDAIVEWQRTVGFASSQHAEQDLVLSRLIVAIANDDVLGEELVFRGGTCLHTFETSPAFDPIRVTFSVASPSERCVNCTFLTSDPGRVGATVDRRSPAHPVV